MSATEMFSAQYPGETTRRSLSYSPALNVLALSIYSYLRPYIAGTLPRYTQHYKAVKSLFSQSLLCPPMYTYTGAFVNLLHPSLACLQYFYMHKYFNRGHVSDSRYAYLQWTARSRNWILSGVASWFLAILAPVVEWSA